MMDVSNLEEVASQVVDEDSPSSGVIDRTVNNRLNFINAQKKK